MVRYPDTAIIRYTETDARGEDGFFETEPQEMEVQGRFEPTVGNTNFEYSGKFFCKKLNLEAFKVDNSTLEIESLGGREFKIAHLYNYQTHCEIWLQ